MLKLGADPNPSDNMGNTILHIAASKGHLSGLKALLNAINSSTSISAKIKANDKNIKEQTPLILACMGGHHSEDIIETLVKAGSDVNIRDIEGKTALHYAAEYDFDLMPLLTHGADPNIIYHNKNTVLHMTASKGYSLCVRALLNMHVGFSRVPFAPKINVNAKNIKKQTPLIIACIHRREDIIESLINAGCDVNIRDVHGGTALCYAVHTDIESECIVGKRR